MSATATPMLKQYKAIKSQYEDCILLFRLGDFYEMFYEDAKDASRILDLVLTSRGKGTANQMPMCGVPHHSADNYIAKLIKAGRKVAICEQVEDPSVAKGIVKRDVIRVITSGTFLDEQSTDARYILCLIPDAKGVGLAFIDPTTGTIHTNQYDTLAQCAEITARLPVCECVYPECAKEDIKVFTQHPLLNTKTILFSVFEDWAFNKDLAEKNLCEHFNLPNLRGFGIADMALAISSAGALLEYLKSMNRQPLKHIDRISLYADDDYAYISPAAIAGLELNSVFRTINRTLTPMGKRKLRYWLFHPLKKPATILARQAAVTILKDDSSSQSMLKTCLGAIPDIEKSLSRLSCGYTNAKDVFLIGNALALIPGLEKIITPLKKKSRLFSVNDIPNLRTLLESAINPDMPLTKYEGKVIRPGFHQELDELRNIQENSRQYLQNFQKREIERTGISSLKIGFNKVFGYYIEITKANLPSAPDDYIRKQTLVNAERFITQELKDYEERILSAQDKILKIENEILAELLKNILTHSKELHDFADMIARIDAIYSLADLAETPNYIAPQIDNGPAIDIRDGRHPVVERTIDTAFVANDTFLHTETDHLLILTGPNMAGKSTYIRQTAILVILAQMGSYIPADQALIGVADKIFTRIGAHDDIAKGQSTFMVEMNEMADILNNLSERSLVILDEIGRGTSTYDGLSLAWAIAQHLQNTHARVLFATHFHELTVLADEHAGIKNYNVAVKEWKDEVVFLHKIIPGSTDDSYGIYVAKLAGVPEPVIQKAKKVLTRLELKQDLKGALTGNTSDTDTNDQLDFFSSDIDPASQEIKDALENIDLNSLTPLEAMTFLNDLKKKIDDKA